MLKRILLAIGIGLMLCFSLKTSAQTHTHCGFTCHEKHEEQANNQLNSFILASQTNLGLEPYSTCSNVSNGKIKLPVVFHLIHENGVPAGTGSNWTNGKINTLLTQLNDLYAHKSGETFTNPFSGTDIEFEFVLAKRDPLNNLTDGIEHHITANYQSVSMATDTPMKAAYHWNTNNYINIYVVKNVIEAAAYALFPSFHGNVRDGVVVAGNSGSATLLTHELGHYFGLYHTFQGGCANGNCLETGDRVCDTPPKSVAGMAGGTCGAPSNSCITDDDDTDDHNPFRSVVQGGIGDQPDALENYMDYTGACYGGFTQGQRNRMRATLFALRSSLLNANTYPPSVQDLSLETIVFPTNSLCNKVSDVIVRIKNNGNSAISNFPLVLELNGVGRKTITYSGTLASGASADVTFDDIIFDDGINSMIVHTDWDQDGIPENNMTCASTTYNPPLDASTIHANFESSLGEWSIVNPDQLVGLAPFDFSACAANENKVLAFESLKTAGSGSGSNDYLVSKTIDLSDATSASIKFNYSYKNFYSNLQTILSLEASQNCGQSYQVLDTKTSFGLNTTTFDRKYSPYYPTSCDDWATETIDLSAYLGDEVTLRFNIELEGSQGQNLFLDNINIDIVRDNIPDCNGDIGGTAENDACGVCSGGLTGLVPNATCVDCNNEVNGTASLDACNVCSGGSTNIDPNSNCTDCHGDINGTAVIDGCGECTGGNTGIAVNSGCIDCNNIPGGSAVVDACGVCSGGTTGLVVNATCLDCNADPNGTATIDACGECAGGRTGKVLGASCTDCHGDLNGTAEIDLCGECSGGNTGLVANSTCLDCHDDINGTAIIDACGVCADGNTGIIANSTCTDCNSEVNGTAILDACGNCAGGSTGITPDNSCINAGGCSKINVTSGVFCTPNSSVRLIASSESGSCNNLKWYSAETGGTALSTGCIFDTPNLSSSRSYFVEDNVNLNTPSNTGNFITGFRYNSSGLSNFQTSGLNTGQYVQFTANETTVLKSVKVHFSDCNNFTRFTVRLDKVNGAGVSQTKIITPGCKTNSPTKLTLDFNVVAGTTYNLYIDNLQKNQSGTWQNGNGTFRYHQQMTGGFSNYFSATKLAIQNIQGYQGTGPFYDWAFASTCPRTEVFVVEKCIEICGNSIDDDGDGEVDEACKNFTCSGRLLQSLGDKIYQMDVSPVAFNELLTLPFRMNSLAYNPLDNKVYATYKSDDANKDKYVRIDSDGEYEILGFITKPNGDNLGSFSADIGYDGVYYVYENPTKILYAVNLKTLIATPVVTDVGYGLADIAYNPENGRLYGVASGLQKMLIEMDPVTGLSNNLGELTGLTNLVSGSTGAVYFSPTGELIAFGAFLTTASSTSNSQNDLIQIDIATLEAEYLGESTVLAAENDGASCPYTVKVNKQASVTEISPGEEFNYVIDVYNQTGFTLSNINFADVLPLGLEIQEVLVNEIGPLKNDILTSPDIIEIENFVLTQGVSQLEFRVKLEEGALCDSFELPNQAVLRNLPAALGEVVVSDDPTTNKELDTTFVTVRENVGVSLGTFNLAGATLCGGILEETLILSGSIGELEWEYSSDGSTWVAYSGVIVNDSTITISETNTGNAIVDHYYRAKIENECGIFYNELQFSLAPETPRPLVNNSEYCLNDAPVTLTATGTELKWYTTLGGASVSVGPTPGTAMSGVTNYFVTQTLNKCESDPAIQDVIVTVIPDAPDLGPYEYCKDLPGNSLNLGTSHLLWYESPTDDTPSFDEPTIDFSTASNTTYYVSYTINGCESNKGLLNIVINDPETPLTEDVAYCLNDVSTALTATGNNLQWYTTPNLVSGSSVAPTPSTSAVDTLYFYITQMEGICESSSDTLEVIINGIPTATLEAGGTFCSENLETEELTITVVGGTAPYNIAYTYDNGADGTVTIATGKTASINSTVGTDLGVGTYSITTITDSNNCNSVITEEEAVISIHPDLVVVNKESCATGTQTANISATISGGVSADYAVSLETPETGIITASGYILEFLTSGVTDYSYTISDSTGCLKNSITITDDIECGCPVIAELSLASSSDTIICPTETATLEVIPSGSIDGVGAVYEVILSGPITVANPTGEYMVTTITAGGVHQFEVNDAGVYTIKSVSDGNCEGIGSGSKIITVLEEPSFDQNLITTPIRLCPGDELNLQVGASGSGITYQWKQGTTNLSGPTATTNNYVKNMVVDQATDGGDYSVEVKGTCGVITSAITPVIINEEVIIDTDLSTVLIDLCPGDPLNLNITATGTPEIGNTDLTYLWTAPNGVTSSISSLNIVSVEVANTGDYSLTVTGACNSVESDKTPVRVGTETAIIAQPSLIDADLCPGEDFTLDVTAIGNNLTYQWQKNDVDTVGATDSSLTITNVNAWNVGTYSVIVSGTCDPGTPKTPVTSVDVNISIGNPTVIVTEPQDASACALSNATFGVTATGDNLTYQWYKDSAPLSDGGNVIGVTTTSLGIDPTALADTGDYTVIVTGECGADTSEVAVLQITSTEFPKVTLSVDRATICEGEDVTLTATGGATGLMPLYEFRQAGTTTVLQVEGTDNTYSTTGGLITDRSVEVIMTSNSLCIDPSAINPVTDVTDVTVISSPSAIITTPFDVDTQYVARDEITLETTNPGVGYNLEWYKQYPSQQGVIQSHTSNVTELTELTTKEPDPSTGVGTTDIILMVKDNNDICEASTDTITIIRKDITEPLISDAELCITDPAHVVIGNAIIPGFETATMIDVHNGSGNGLNSRNIGTSLTFLSTPMLGSTEDIKDFIVKYEIVNRISATTLTDSATIRIYNTPSIADAGEDITTCASAVNLAGNTPEIGTGEWICTGGTLSDAGGETSQLSGLIEGETVTCVWTIRNGVLCNPSGDTVTIEKVGQVTTPTIYLDNVDVTGDNLDICITDLVSLRGEEPIAPETGEWKTVNGISISGVTGVISNQGTLNLEESGVTRLEWTITSPFAGCEPESRFVDITVHDEPIADITSILSTDTCAGIDISATTAPIEATDVATWTSTITPETTGSNSWNIVSTDLSVGNNVITYQVDNAGCDPIIATEIITIEAITNINVNLNYIDTLCESATANYIAKPTGGGPNPSYVWSYTEDLSITGTTRSNILDLANVQESSGRISVEMISSLRCTDKPSIATDTTLTVVQGPLPVILTPDTTICITSPITLEGQDNNLFAQATSYNWYRNETIPVGESDELFVSGITQPGSYVLIANNGICAPVKSNEIKVEVRHVPEVNASANGINPQIVSEDDLIILEGSHTGTSLTWTTVDPFDVTIIHPNENNSKLEVREGGIYEITLTSINGPCRASDAVEINVRSRINAPNVFTPNGDGEFETFSIKGIETYPNALVMIFNRWGKKIYESDDYPSNEWDASNVPDGVYYFVVKTGDEEDKGHSGVIHVIR